MNSPTLSDPRPGMLLLEDGTLFRGRVVSEGTRFGEVVFNTSMTGYQEILTDPSYRGQIVVLTGSHQGNYGVEDGGFESSEVQAEALLVRHMSPRSYEPASPQGLGSFMRQEGVPALEGIDTRALVRRIREFGSLRGVVTSESIEIPELLERVKETPLMEGQALALEAGCQEGYTLEAEGEERVHLAVWDFGVKRNILRSLTARGARVTVLPPLTAASAATQLKVDGVVLSNGPGDPAALPQCVREVQALANSGIPILGICLGHQLLALALGAKTYKLPFGHHGGNQPVQDLRTGRILITSQNHGFAVEGDSLPEGCRVSQINLNDQTVEGLEVESRPILSVQYHPEAAPGPLEASFIFDRFFENFSPNPSNH